MAAAEQEAVGIDEAVRLGAKNGVFYSHYFFPKMARQESAPFHPQIWDLFERNRYAHARVFRGGAKTSVARVFTSKRIAYGISHTVLYIGKSQDAAARSVEWIMRAVEHNELWRNAFHLRKGSKWTGIECEICSDVFEQSCRIIALGISGSVRGVNVDDYRPDLIIVDDPLDEENAATPEARKKINDLFFGAIKETLVPESEDPSAGLFLLQTPFAQGDLSDVCMTSSDFATLQVGILDDYGNSAWPARWSVEQINQDKSAAIQRNQLSVWMREKMCRIVSAENSAFLAEWLQYWVIIPQGARFVMAVDPAPVQSEVSRAKGIETDQQAVMVCAYYRGQKYVIEYGLARDQDPEALMGHVNRLARKYHINLMGVEGIAYQRTLKWYLEKEMKEGRCKHLRIVELNVGGPQSKDNRIRQAHVGRASSGCLHVNASHVEYIEQFTNYPNVKFRDLLDVSAMCDATIGIESGTTYDEDGNEIDESDIEEMKWNRGAP